MAIILVLQFTRGFFSVPSLFIDGGIIVAFNGLDWIAMVPPTIGITRQIFGMNKSGIIYGWIFAFHQAGAATAAYGGGLIYKLFDSYT